MYKKRTIASISVFLLVLIIAACITGCSERTTHYADCEQQWYKYRAPTINNNEKLENNASYPPDLTPAYGGIYNAGTTSIESFLDIDMNSPLTLPIIVNQFPYSQGGIDIAVTEEVVSMVKGKMYTFLELAGITLDPSTLIYEEMNEGVYLIEGVPGLKLSSASPIGLHLTLDLEPNISPVTYKDVESNIYYRAAMKYIGLNNPCITHQTELDIDGNVICEKYTLFNRGATIADTILNQSFSNLMVTIYPNEGNYLVSLSIQDVPREEIAGIQTLSSYETALAQIMGESSLSANSKVTCEVIYDANLEYGYYIPAYRFYISQDSADESTAVYQVYTIRAVEHSASN